LGGVVDNGGDTGVDDGANTNVDGGGGGEKARDDGRGVEGGFVYFGENCNKRENE
jgi:hypothetical protein